MGGWGDPISAGNLDSGNPISAGNLDGSGGGGGVIPYLQEAGCGIPYLQET